MFGELFTRHGPVVHGYLKRRAGPDVAEEVLSETFLTAFQQRATFDTTWESARPWLLGIATRLLHAHGRREARHLRVQARAAEREDHDGGIARAGERADAVTAVAAIRDAIARLSVADRDTLLLHAWGDLNQEQTAAALQVPLGTVKSRLNRARRTLRASVAASTTDENTTDEKEAHRGRVDVAAGA